MISVSHVSKVVGDVGSPLAILRDIDFTVNAGESVAILGASGSGKSTLLSIMAGLDTPTEGHVSLAGQQIFEMTEDQRAAWRGQKLGFVFQNFQLMGHLTALENVMLPLELSGIKDAAKLAKEILSQVGLAERLKHFPKVLSGGEQQRVAIARSLMQEPQMLLADEPVASLDPESSGQVLELLLTIAKEENMTVICTLHQVELALGWAHRIVGLRAGKVVLDRSALGLDQRDVMDVYQRVEVADAPTPSENVSIPLSNS